MGMSSLIAQAAGGGMKAVGNYYATKGEKLALNTQASLDEINADIARGKYRDRMEQGEREHSRIRLSTAELKGEQRAAYADNGLDLGFGTPAQVLAGTDLLGEVDAATVRSAAVREAMGFRLQETELRTSATVNRSAAKALSPGMAAATTLLTEAGSVASSWYNLKASGAFGKENKAPIERGNLRKFTSRGR